MPLEQEGQQQHHGHAQRRYQRYQKSVVLKKTFHGLRPGELAVGFQPKLGHGPGHVQGKLVGRRILAGVVTAAAIVAQVGQILQILPVKRPPELHGRKHGAETLRNSGRRCRSPSPVQLPLRSVDDIAHRLLSCDSTKNRTDGHPEPGHITLSQDVAGHDLARPRRYWVPASSSCMITWARSLTVTPR